MKKLIAIVVAVVLTLAVSVPALAAPSGYTDTAGTWFEDDAAAYGYPDIFDDGSGLFHPNQDITRIEFVRLLHKALGLTIYYFAPTDVGTLFTDMSNEDDGASALVDLVTAGIVDSGGAFNPDASLTREVMIHWTIRALDYVTGGDYAMIEIYPAPFDDDACITPMYKNDIVKSVVLNLIYGRGDNKLFPTDGATRAEAVTVVSRLMALLKTLQTDVSVTPSAIVSNGALTTTLTISNNSSDPVTILYSSGQRFDYQVLDESGISLYTWSADKAFIAQTAEQVLAPGEQLTYSDTLDAELFGAMSDQAAKVCWTITGTSPDFTVEPDGYTVDLLVN